MRIALNSRFFQIIFSTTRQDASGMTIAFPDDVIVQHDLRDSRNLVIVKLHMLSDRQFVILHFQVHNKVILISVPILLPPCPEAVTFLCLTINGKSDLQLFPSRFVLRLVDIRACQCVGILSNVGCTS